MSARRFATRADARGADAAPLAPLMLAAAVIHVAAAAEHASESAWVAVAFVAMAVAQAAVGVRLLRRAGARTATIAASASGLIAFIWLATRTTHLPFLPETPEPVGAADLAATMLEVAVVLGATAGRRGASLERFSMAAWGASAALATTAFAAAHGSEHGGGAAALHGVIHLGPVAAAFSLFAYVVVAAARRGDLSFSIALRSTSSAAESDRFSGPRANRHAAAS